MLVDEEGAEALAAAGSSPRLNFHHGIFLALRRRVEQAVGGAVGDGGREHGVDDGVGGGKERDEFVAVGLTGDFPGHVLSQRKEEIFDFGDFPEEDVLVGEMGHWRRCAPLFKNFSDDSVDKDGE